MELAVQKQGRTQYLVSRRAPDREAGRLVERLGRPEIVLLFGWGLGHVFEELRRGNPSCLVLCFEPDLVDNPALNSPNLDSKGVHIHRLSNDSEARLAVVRRCLSEQYYALVAKKFSLVGMPGYLSAFPDYWEDIQSTVDSWQRETARDLELQSRIGARWLENGLRNLPHWSSAPHSTLTAKKVYGLGAGPSGTEVLSKLAGRRDQVAIVAGDTAAGWLAAFGYSADIVCSLDCQWYTGLHGRRRLARQGLWIVDSSIDPAFRRRLSSTVPAFGAHPLTPILLEEGLPHEALRPGYATVGQWVVDLVRGIPAEVQHEFLGLDGAYPGYRAYCAGTYRETWDLTRNSRLHSMESIDLEIMSRGQTTKLVGKGAGYAHLDLAAPDTTGNADAWRVPRYEGLDWSLLARRTYERLLDRWEERITDSRLSKMTAETAVLMPGAFQRRRLAGGKSPNIFEHVEAERRRLRWLVLELRRAIP